MERVSPACVGQLLHPPGPATRVAATQHGAARGAAQPRDLAGFSPLARNLLHGSGEGRANPDVGSPVLSEWAMISPQWSIEPERRMEMRHLLVALSLLLGSVGQAGAQVSVGVGVALPGVQIGINVPAYPRLVAVPGYPVYYAPAAPSNYFFYDGAYWVYRGDTWYVSSWYAGPWYVVEPYDVPVYLLRVPVRYYRDPPPYFRAWRPDRPPRWGERWGHDWEARRAGWDRWDRRQVPRPAPLPVYQRSYAGDRYPREVEQQRAIHAERYRYQPHEPATRQHYGDAGGWRGGPARPPPGNRAPPPAPHGEHHGRGDDRGEGRR